MFESVIVYRMNAQGGETVSQDNVDGWVQIAKLQARFPRFAFRLIEGRGRDDSRIEAVRKGGSDEEGLYAVISTDPAEVARELKRAA